ncbi:MAG: hypothetical protein HYV99_05710 [Betaproteobacteria bacterium]|nr:hypothetical protein [Betaproteobacteria bacterium]
MNAFEVAISEVLRLEGGYIDDPRDAGGRTRWGISQRSYPHIDVAALTRDAAIEIYRRDYWMPLRGDELPPALALVVFDCAVNMGRVRASKLLQETLGVGTDGVIGPQTLAAAARAPLPWAVTDFLARRAYAYGSITDFVIFGRGWMKRVLEIHAAALALVP